MLLEEQATLILAVDEIALSMQARMDHVPYQPKTKAHSPPPRSYNNMTSSSASASSSSFSSASGSGSSAGPS